MAKELKDKLRPIADEYAKAVGNVIGYEPEYWVGSDINLDCCCYGDCYFLGLDEMQVIVDHMSGWIEKYGSQEKVGETVVEWLDFVIDDNWDEEHGLWRNHPRINLWSWLNGLRPDMLTWTAIDELTKLEVQTKVLKQVFGSYPTASIENAINQIEARCKEIKCRINAENMAAMKQLPGYEDLGKAIEDENGRRKV